MHGPSRTSAVLAVGLGIVLCACDTARVTQSSSPMTTAVVSSVGPSTPPATAHPTTHSTPEPTLSAIDAIVHCTGEPSNGLGGASVERDSTWAGYVAARPPGTFSCVEGSWREPTVTCGAADAAVHYWVGIGGYTSSDLGIFDNIHAIQKVGTGVECEDGEPDHYAWHQVAPRESSDQPFDPAPDGGDLVIEPGDLVWAQIRYTGDAFVMTVANLSTGDMRSTTARGGDGHRSSAEWVVGGEPGEPIARFDSFTFLDGLSTMDGVVGPIGSKAWRRNWVDEWGGGVRRLGVSPLSDDGGSFGVTWHHR